MEGLGKKGILTPDKYGYYRVLAGGLDTYSTSGAFYSSKGTLQFFDETSSFMRRIKKDCVYAENGHPKPLPGMTKVDYINRLLDIREDRVCGHISNLIIDPLFGQNNPDQVNREMIGLFIDVKPDGELGYVLQDAIDNPKQNLAFSKRTLTNDQVGSNRQLTKYIHTAITFDKVNEGGIVAADRRNAIGLENHEELVDTDLLKEILSDNIQHLGLEDSTKKFYEEVMEAVSKTDVKRRKNSKIFKW